MDKRKQQIGFFCANCRNHGTKSASYLVRRFKEGHKQFYCSRKCADKAQSIRMTGTRNPNYNGTWHGGDQTKIMTTDQRRKYALESIEKFKNDGSFEWRMKRLQEGHQKFFSTEKGKSKRRMSGVISVQKQSRGHRTSIEAKMAEELNARGIDFIEQFPIGNKFLIDFVIPEYKIAVECDGDYWHRLPKSVARDKSKNAYLKACGYSVHRFWEHEINEGVSECVDFVVDEMLEKEGGRMIGILE